MVNFGAERATQWVRTSNKANVRIKKITVWSCVHQQSGFLELRRQKTLQTFFFWCKWMIGFIQKMNLILSYTIMLFLFFSLSFVFLKTGFLRVVPAVLKLALVESNQAGIELRSTSICFPNAGIKGMCQHHLAPNVFSNRKYCDLTASNIALCFADSKCIIQNSEQEDTFHFCFVLFVRHGLTIWLWKSWNSLCTLGWSKPY